MNFNQLFKKISAESMNDNVFTLVGNEFFTVTAGKKNHYNSMVASGGGFGVLFKKPVSWCIFRSDRYTLEMVQKEHTYTLSYFPHDYREEMMFLGSKSGRNSDKMKETKLSNIETPFKNISFEEARLIFECKLIQVTTPAPDDFYSQEAQNYINEAYKKSSNHRKFVIGEITNIWVKK